VAAVVAGHDELESVGKRAAKRSGMSRWRAARPHCHAGDLTEVAFISVPSAFWILPRDGLLRYTSMVSNP
jgi:hypothetical protein